MAIEGNPTAVVSTAGARAMKVQAAEEQLRYLAGVLVELGTHPTQAAFALKQHMIKAALQHSHGTRAAMRKLNCSQSSFYRLLKCKPPVL